MFQHFQTVRNHHWMRTTNQFSTPRGFGWLFGHFVRNTWCYMVVPLRWCLEVKARKMEGNIGSDVKTPGGWSWQADNRFCIFFSNFWEWILVQCGIHDMDIEHHPGISVYIIPSIDDFLTQKHCWFSISTFVYQMVRFMIWKFAKRAASSANSEVSKIVLQCHLDSMVRKITMTKPKYFMNPVHSLEVFSFWNFPSTKNMFTSSYFRMTCKKVMRCPDKNGLICRLHRVWLAPYWRFACSPKFSRGSCYWVCTKSSTQKD